MDSAWLSYIHHLMNLVICNQLFTLIKYIHKLYFHLQPISNVSLCPTTMTNSPLHYHLSILSFATPITAFRVVINQNSNFFLVCFSTIQGCSSNMGTIHILSATRNKKEILHLITISTYVQVIKRIIRPSTDVMLIYILET